jgi:hypothetical protein
MAKKSWRVTALYAVLTGCMAALTSGCASTELSSSWHSVQPGMAGFKKLLVVGATKDPGKRRIFEDTFVAQANSQGFAAVQSYLSIPQAGEIPEDVVLKALRDNGCDAVMVTRLKRVDKNLAVTGPTYGGTYGSWGPYRGSWAGAYEPRTQVYEQVTITLDVNVYAGGNGQLSWSGTTTTVDPTTLDLEIKHFSKIIVAQMAKDGTIVSTLPAATAAK